MELPVRVSIFNNQLSSVYSSGFHATHQNDLGAFQKHAFQYLNSGYRSRISINRTLEYMLLNVPLGDYDKQRSLKLVWSRRWSHLDDLQPTQTSLVPMPAAAKVLSRVLLDPLSLGPPEIWSLTPLGSLTALTPIALPQLSSPCLTAMACLTQHRWFWPTYNLTKPRAVGAGGVRYYKPNPFPCSGQAFLWFPLQLTRKLQGHRNSRLRTSSLSLSPKVTCPVGQPKMLGKASFVSQLFDVGS